MAWVVRDGLREDVSTLLALFKGLAVAQKCEESVVKVREEDLLRDGFGDTKYFYFVVTEWRSEGDSATGRPEIAGYGFYFLNYSGMDGRIIYLEDLYVKEKYQRNGLGRAMMKKIAEKANEFKCSKLVWSCLDYNLEAFKFYDTLGAKRVDNLTAMRITRQGMKEFLSTSVQLPADVTVRFGVCEDVPVVFSFMKESAVVREGNASMVKISEADLIQDGFTDPKYFYLVVAEKTHGGCSSSSGHELIGFAMYYFSYSTWEGLTICVEDLYVKKEHRQKNVGTALLKKIAEFGVEQHFHRLAWNHTNGNESALKFFEHHKATLLPEWKKMYLDKAAITTLVEEAKT